MAKHSKISKTNLLIASLAGVVFFQVGFLGHDLVLNASLEGYAERVMKKCFEESYPPSCYDEEIPKLMGKISMEDAFEVTRLIQKTEGDKYLYCHVLGHNLSAKETAKDPSKWTDVIARCPSGMCSNGCIHGSFQERFRAEHLPDEEIDKLIPELSEICEAKPNWSPTGLEQASCYHAVGHLIMYITGGSVDKSNDVCGQVALKDDGRNFLQMCYDGNFMQIFQPLEPEDFELIADIAPRTKEDATAYCNDFDGIKKSSCRRESWPLFFDDLHKGPGVVKFCSFFDNEAGRKSCYNAIFYVMTAQYKLDTGRMKELCTELPGGVIDQCFANAASRLIETDYALIDRAVKLCEEAEALNVGEECYNELIFYSTFNFHPGSQEYFYLCGALPEPWNSKCLKND